jgi:Haemolysin-III related
LAPHTHSNLGASIVSREGPSIVSAQVAGATAVARYPVLGVRCRVRGIPRELLAHHRPLAAAWLRRFDHAAMYGPIAGTHTAFGLVVLKGNWRPVVLGIVWIGALAAIAFKFAWVDARCICRDQRPASSLSWPRPETPRRSVRP